MLFLTVLLAQPIAPVFAADEEAAIANESSAVETKEETAPTNSTPTLADQGESEVTTPTETDAAESVSKTTSDATATVTADEAQDVTANSTPTGDSESAETEASAGGGAAASTTSTPTNSSRSTSTQSSASSTPGVVAGAATSTSQAASSSDVALSTDSGTSTVSSGDQPSATESTSPATSTEVIQEPEATTDAPAEAANTPDESIETSETVTTPEDSVADSAVSPTSTLAGAVTMVNHTSDDNLYQFSRSECVSVGDGSFYCSDMERRATDPQSVVYAAPNGGDDDIFFRTKNETIQLTDNTLEDTSPFYDPQSNTVVWHRLINGRYEIISYDLVSKEETVLTDNAVNDMEPSHSGNYTVWQRWVQDSWEIVLFDGSTEKQLTQNEYHDIAPSIRGGYVIWQTNDLHGDRAVGVYEIATGLTSIVADTDGGAIENPRFVLVYDTTYDNGDVVTKGYDFDTGALVPLAAQPTELPEEIPSSDSTGETRAIIQSKPSTPKEEAVDADPVPAGGTDSGPTASSSATTTTTVTTSTFDTIDLSTSATTTNPLQLTEFDLVIEPPASTTTSTQAEDSATTTNGLE